MSSVLLMDAVFRLHCYNMPYENVVLNLGFEGFGEVMKPTQLGQVQSQPQRPQQKLISNDLDASLASLAGSLSVNGPAGMPKQ